MALIIRFAQASKPIKTFINQAHHQIGFLINLKAKFMNFQLMIINSNKKL